MIARETIANQVASYCRRIASGEQVASSFVRGAVDRHLRDLERVTDPEFPYEFDALKAYKSCAFFPVVLKHSIGEWAGHPFELADWQQFVIWCVFGWVQKSDQTRRFRKCYVDVARKNGKSTLVAGMGLLALHMDDEPGAQIFVGATKRDQAAIIHGEAEKMTRSSPSLSRISKVNKLNLSVPATGSFMRPVGSDKPYDGLNPHCVLLDELHAWKEHHRPFWNTITSGSASRRQPLFVIATTAGDDQSWLWIEERKHACDVATGTIQDDRYFSFVACLDKDDRWDDETLWEKANPNLGVSVKLEYLRQQCADAIAKKSYRNTFERYHLNRQVSANNADISREAWDACRGELSDWSQADAIGFGIDLGGRDDLAAVGACARFRVGEDEEQKPIFRYELRCWPFVEPTSKRDLTVAPWVQWIWDEHLTRSQSAIRECQAKVVSLFDQFPEAVAAALDPHNARQFGEELATMSLPVYEMRQNCPQYNEPMREFLTALETGRLRHDGHPVLAWAARNMVSYTNQANEKMPDKGHSKDKIDPIVACIMAFRVVYFAPVNDSGSLIIT